MTRAGLEALIWRQAPELTGPSPAAAMAVILAAVDTYAGDEAARLAALHTTRTLAGYYASDPPGVTARRRAELDAAVSEGPRRFQDASVRVSYGAQAAGQGRSGMDTAGGTPPEPQI